MGPLAPLARPGAPAEPGPSCWAGREGFGPSQAFCRHTSFSRYLWVFSMQNSYVGLLKN
jgi:hypothetical protein